MNALRIPFRPVAALGLLLAASAASIAQEATPWPELDRLQSTRTRAEVAAEAADALRRGLIPRTEGAEQHAAVEGHRSEKTRAQVIAELREAQRLGLVAANEWELNRWRAPTAAELEQIAAAGLRARGEALAAAPGR